MENISESLIISSWTYLQKQATEVDALDDLFLSLCLADEDERGLSNLTMKGCPSEDAAVANFSLHLLFIPETSSA